MKILIDNGHGVETPGKRSSDGRFREYQYNRLIARAIVEHLQCRGYDASLVVPEEEDISLEERCRSINRVAIRHGHEPHDTFVVSIQPAAAECGTAPRAGAPTLSPGTQSPTSWRPVCTKPPRDTFPATGCAPTTATVILTMKSQVSWSSRKTVHISRNGEPECRRSVGICLKQLHRISSPWRCGCPSDASFRPPCHALTALPERHRISH